MTFSKKKLSKSREIDKLEPDHQRKVNFRSCVVCLKMDEKERCESKLGFSVSGVISSIAARYTNQAIVTLRESCPAQPGLRVGSLWHRASSIVPLHLRDGRVCEE